jgi:radical SAM superfamily enzyme YgiQ (UPF0313 family)
MAVLSQQYGCQSVWFGDDCFNVDGDLIAAICEGVLERGIEMNWFYQGRADLVVRYRDLLPLMRRAGNRMVQIGIETCSDDELVSMNKRLTVEEMREAVELLKEHDIVGQGMIMLGTPADDARSMEDKLRFPKRLDLDFPVFTVYTPFPGSGAYDYAQARGWLDEEFDYAHFDMAHVLLPTEHPSKREVSRWYWWCLSSYYMDPIKVVRGIFSGREWKRAVWRHMMAYNVKKRLQFLFSLDW